MKPVTILKRARKLIEKPDNWLNNGELVRGGRFGSPTVRAFCPLGALCTAAGSLAGNKEAERLFKTAIKSDLISSWNDQPNRRHRSVLAAFDRAIALAEKEARQ